MDTITTIQSLLTFDGSASPATVALMPNERSLIAAGPELLEALQSVMSLMTECDCTNSDEDGPPCPCKQARAAIAKATGAT